MRGCCPEHRQEPEKSSYILNEHAGYMHESGCTLAGRSEVGREIGNQEQKSYTSPQDDQNSREYSIWYPEGFTSFRVSDLLRVIKSNYVK